MASQHSQEVQLLLAAERRAAEKVAEARKRKAKRLRQAKEEATAEIELFKAERGAAFAKYEKEHLGSKGDIEKKICEETEVKLKAMSSRIDSTRGVIIGRLIEEVVSNVNPKLHKNKLSAIQA